MSSTRSPDLLTVAIAQIAPVWLDRERTLRKVERWVGRAADRGARLVAFGEALVPGYPWWIEHTDGARFNSPLQKTLHAHYLDQAVDADRGDLNPLCALARRRKIAIVLGTIERPRDRGGHSVYCSLMYVSAAGRIESVHRKLMPTYEERLSWSPGDGHGLVTHPLGAFTLGRLNCWENWMPLARTALYAQGEDLHVASWPGSDYNTRDITRFAAREGRSYVLAASTLMRRRDVPASVPHAAAVRRAIPAMSANGGSGIAGPDGEWIVPPVTGREALIVRTIDHRRVREERQNFDAAGHYGRPDVTQLTVDRTRQRVATFIDQGRKRRTPKTRH
ncbi:MAG: carbon-nitrogen hydrolase family protein [Gemmatimonadetes bacterium]|nr:carbon-nitrogen hydrolase family protein [Gemmatimonadota bacterium]